MKKSAEVNELNEEINFSINKVNEDICNISIQFNEYYKKIKKEMNKVLVEEKIALLIKISEGEDIDINTLKSKYLKPKELSMLNKNITKTDTVLTEELLDRIEYKDNIYYHSHGKVFDIDNKQVGTFKDNSISFT